MPSVGDSPIGDPGHDLLERGPLVDAFVRHVFGLLSGDGIVAGVLGPWGAGKTSFLNLARPGLEQSSSAVVDFNPWMFSGAEQLVDRFFIELAAQLKLKPGLAKTAKRVLDYGDAFAGLGWLPVVGTWIERGRLIAGGTGKLLERRRQGIGGRRDALKKALRELDRPVVVVLDDIDRLTTAEIRDVFKLVRLTANFPNVIYLVAFDRHRVEAALDEDGIPGRDYLEKILAFALDVPPVPGRVLPRLLAAAIDDALEGADDLGPFDSGVWVDLLYEVVLPQVRTMRDIRRYAAAIRPTVDQVAGAVALADLLALESVRIFMPDVFARLHASIGALTATSDLSGVRRQDDEGGAAIVAMQEAAGDDGAVVRALVTRLFPAAQRHIGGSHYGSDWKKTWLRGRRVAHEAVLRRYLECVGGPELGAFDAAERAWALFDDPQGLDSYVRSLAPETLTDVISSLETFQDDFAADHALSVVVVLLNMPLPDQTPRAPFAVDSRLAVTRVVLRLLWALTPRHADAVDAERVEKLVREALPSLRSLSAQLELITIVGYVEGVGHRLVTEGFAAEVQADWARRADAASAADLADEPELTRVLLQREEWTPDGAQLGVIPSGPAITRAVLLGALRESQSWAVGNRAVRTTRRLAWDTVVRLLGGDDSVRLRVQALRYAGLPDPEQVCDLAEQYVAGWRPEDFT